MVGEGLLQLAAVGEPKWMWQTVILSMGLNESWSETHPNFPCGLFHLVGLGQGPLAVPAPEQSMKNKTIFAQALADLLGVGHQLSPGMDQEGANCRRRPRPRAGW